ncbi:hypothetical protein [Pectinatus sottacetonis]|nr:hypothetical protein [Pectinatus sottacetonis]
MKSTKVRKNRCAAYKRITNYPIAANILDRNLMLITQNTKKHRH